MPRSENASRETLVLIHLRGAAPEKDISIPVNTL